MHTSGTLELNSRFVESTELRDFGTMINLITHEVRHAFQYVAMENPQRYGISQETADLWWNNWNNYISWIDDPRGYRSQPVEADARRFAQDVMDQSGLNLPHRM